ncbi:MAG TPA: hypothetical protein VEP73_12380 [Actinomycetota bacterium]|nr:hypothetical protein [Actinomycetota bacterium]
MFSLTKIGADGIARELEARWVDETVLGLTVFVATEHCMIPLDRAEARRFARWLAGQVE